VSHVAEVHVVVLHGEKAAVAVGGHWYGEVVVEWVVCVVFSHPGSPPLAYFGHGGALATVLVLSGSEEVVHFVVPAE
jgi:hypothetical protein